MKISRKRENTLPAIGCSMVGGGDGAPVAEVTAASLPARRLGAMKNCKVLKFWMRKKKMEREFRSLKTRRGFKRR